MKYIVKTKYYIIQHFDSKSMYCLFQSMQKWKNVGQLPWVYLYMFHYLVYISNDIEIDLYSLCVGYMVYINWDSYILMRISKKFLRQ